jgi:succinoglycan biosynthesis protein ExoM
MMISICIATYRRPERLGQLLSDLCKQNVAIAEVVVVDNDAAGSAREVVADRRAAGCPFELLYDVQPERNIALTRNRTVELASGEWVAFIDDDERAPMNWLRGLVAATGRFGADGVLGPVVPQVPAEAAAWIRRGRFYEFPRMTTGEDVPLNRMRFGNILLRGTVLRAEPGPFNVNYGLTTGEDADLLIRLVEKGARIIWCDEAPVYEPIEAARLSLRWLVMRALSGGQEFARKTVAGRYGPVTLAGRTALLARASVQMFVAAGLAGVSWPLGRHIAAAWLVRAAANLGKISIFWGWRYDEYA